MTLPSASAQPVAFLRALFDVAVARAQPRSIMAPFLPPPPKGRTLVIGAGKASGAMVEALDALWPQDAPISGLVATRYGYVPPALRGKPGRIELVETAHPVPDAAGEAAARRMLALTRGLTADDLVVCLISGGGSALLPLPAEGLSLADKQRINRELLMSGATIGEMNCVRKHLSAIKGGRLAAACAPAQVLTLLISDVPGDDPATIASGPTVPDPTTCAQALEIIERYGIDIPASIRAGLLSGALETPKPGDPVFSGNRVELIATPRQMLQAVAEACAQAGLPAHILADDMEGESRDIALAHAALARSVARHGTPFAKPCVILSGGETTVTVAKGSTPGKGGRGTEFLLALALALDGEAGVWALAGDTDGIDGSEDNAGAWITPDTLTRARAAGLSPRAVLDGHDAYTLFAATGDLLVPGPTYTNVNDFRAVLVL
ncbi:MULTISPECIES: glycerate kinase [unclassified Thiomonas]|jgi:hydroxypyruvate reductase|uniref:glycerate kinase type-2 family protein n=1 Tax=unclassified Thiomonas TaxID=2625466 RepID=UPI0004DBBB66|nr:MULTISPECIES: glycerate kinase [unclassified Thiomonas]MDD4999720.1 glycerate kinase [Thiomonas arsenitoxydans]CQR43221.1 putative hydroxypyruvate reductase [Thiomonas sp. CB3]CDW93859.1 putative hydroxypyruvate reductase [Thiomonas sp. CB2]VDY04756.1 putative hydroxypyruvate reductase [Thiomonas sp. Bio17B3]VDY08072.1 putative hydroxypyruvate reductase [Thiomonas sp. Sup16B3]